MAKIEFLMKWMTEMSPEELEQDRIDRLSGKLEDEAPIFNRKFVYKDLVLDINRDLNFNRAERGHTYVRTPDDAFVLKIPYENFKAIYVMQTGELINSYKDFKFLEDDTVDFSPDMDID